ncbi:hypothetical protein Taro_052124 [Colocasia esculenta]|uniref:Endonuclease/exonuclease/phosphatase domain-containing protein n=1 Tax=Colocasia esculenta TaxID=4460 RepID=A0A843XHS2_COLES|nr:hypothetical protein [Colocasia esculenta]
MNCNTLIWNIRGVANAASKKSLKNIVMKHKPQIVGISEPKTSLSNALGLCQGLHMDSYASNMGDDSKIWVFWKSHDLVQVAASTSQFISLSCNADTSTMYYLTFVYADCNSVIHRDLFRDLLLFAQSAGNAPWMITGDFNCISQSSEKSGGNLSNFTSMSDFNDFIMTAGLFDAGYIGSPFTWSNKRTGSASVKARLDRAMFNSSWQDLYPQTTIRHLPRGVSDHSPLLIAQQPVVKLPSRFVFLDIWASHDTFLHVVSTAWNRDEKKYYSFDTLISRLKAVKQVLRTWNKEVFGYVQDAIGDVEARVHLAEQEFDSNPSEANRIDMSAAHAQLRRALINEEKLWCQKSRMEWMQNGDRNTAFYQAVVKNNRRRNFIHKLKIHGSDQWCEDQETLKGAASSYFEDLLTSDHPTENAELLQVIPSLIHDEQNSSLCAIPDRAEVYDAVKAMNEKGDPGPDGFPGSFYVTCWDIIGEDVVTAFLDFLRDYEAISEQKVNASKSSFVTSHKAPADFILRIKAQTGYKRQEGVLSYLGAPITSGRTLVSHYKHITDRVTSSLAAWKSKILSQAGRIVLINSVL